MNVIQEFEIWNGIQVNTSKTKLMTVDGITSDRSDPVTVTYRNESLYITPESESVRYLGFWSTPNGNMWHVMIVHGWFTVFLFSFHVVLYPCLHSRSNLSRSRRFHGTVVRYLKLPTDFVVKTSIACFGSSGWPWMVSFVLMPMWIDSYRQKMLPYQIMKNNLNRVMQKWLCTSTSRVISSETRSSPPTRVEDGDHPRDGRPIMGRNGGQCLGQTRSIWPPPRHQIVETWRSPSYKGHILCDNHQGSTNST